MQPLPKTLADLTAQTAAARRQNDPANTTFERVTQDIPSLTGAIPDRLKWPSHFSSETEIRNRARADWQQVDPRIAEFAFRFMAAMAKEKIPFFVHAAYRTRDEQNAAVKGGNSKTPWPRASHCQGKAVDIVHSRYAWLLTPPEWRWVGIVGKQIHADMMKATPADQRWQITWGGDWKNPYDPAHWEISDWRGSIRIPVEANPVRIHCIPRLALQRSSWLNNYACECAFGCLPPSLALSK